MLKKIDIRKGKNQQKIWDYFDFHYKGVGIGFFRKHRNIKCDCSICRIERYFKRYTNKQDRKSFRIKLRNIILSFVTDCDGMCNLCNLSIKQNCKTNG